MRRLERNSGRRIDLVDVLGAIAAVLLGIQALNYIVALISNFSATFMVFGYQAESNVVVGILGILLLLVFALIPAALSGFPSLGLIQSLALKMSSPSQVRKNRDRALVPAISLLFIEIVLGVLAHIGPLTNIPCFGSVLALMGARAAKEILSSIVIVALLYVAHVKSKNLR